MRYNSSSDGQLLRRQAAGPHALMMRNAVTAFVPDRGAQQLGALGTYLPFRSKKRVYGFGAITQAQQNSLFTSAIGTAATAVAAGAGAGSVAGPIGAAVGALIGLGMQALNRVDPESADFNGAIALANQQGPASVVNITNPYLVLAGLFDLESSQIKGNIPIYKKYGRMGEQKFVTDMCNLIYSAAQRGQITATDTATSIYNNIVLPWINSFGFGAMSDSNAAMITYILMSMIAEYCAGNQTRWTAVGGQYPFGGLPKFALPQAATVAPLPTASPTPSPVAATAAPVQYPAGHIQGPTGVLPTPYGTFSWGSADGSDYLVLQNGKSVAGGILLNWDGSLLTLISSTGATYQYTYAQGFVQTGAATTSAGASTPTYPPELQSYMAGTMPQAGATVNYARDSVTQQFMAVPPGASFVGTTSAGAWILQYSTGQYVLASGTLTGYSGTAPTSSAVIAPTDTAASLVEASTVGEEGSGAVYDTPVSAVPTTVATVTAATNVSSNTLWLLAAAGLAIYLLSQSNSRQVAS
jgi:hypothetical protein